MWINTSTEEEEEAEREEERLPQLGRNQESWEQLLASKAPSPEQDELKGHPGTGMG